MVGFGDGIIRLPRFAKDNCGEPLPWFIECLMGEGCVEKMGEVRYEDVSTACIYYITYTIRSQ